MNYNQENAVVRTAAVIADGSKVPRISARGIAIRDAHDLQAMTFCDQLSQLLDGEPSSENLTKEQINQINAAAIVRSHVNETIDKALGKI